MFLYDVWFAISSATWVVIALSILRDSGLIGGLSRLPSQMGVSFAACLIFFILFVLYVASRKTDWVMSLRRPVPPLSMFFQCIAGGFIVFYLKDVRPAKQAEILARFS